MPRTVLLFAACVLSSPWMWAAQLSGVVKDPSGAVISGAAVTAQPVPSGAVTQTVSDAQGRFHFTDLAPGSYTVAISRAGFEAWQRQVNLRSQPVELTVSLKVKSVVTSVQVSGGRSKLANSDPNYRALRGGKLTKVYRVHDLTLTRDAGRFTFRSGSFSFLPLVMGRVTTGVFVGDGRFELTPSLEIAAKHLNRASGADRVSEDFTALVIYFSDSTFDEIRQHAELADDSLVRHEDALKRIREIIDYRREPASPMMFGGHQLTFLERLLNYEDIPNEEAEVLSELYNPAQGASFRAFIHGVHHADLRFLFNPRGALPTLNAPEEVALVNFDPSSESDGIWYLSHTLAEVRSGRASSSEDKRLIEPEHYQIETVIRKDNAVGQDSGISVTCQLRFHSLDDGTRMVKFDLVPDLQVARVAWNGQEIPFVQESRKQNGSFYLEMPEPLVKGRPQVVTFEYSGGEIVRSDFGPVSPRRVWYPRPSGGISRATYDLRFHVPHGTTVVSSGKFIREERDGAYDVSDRSATTPIEFAAFKYLTERSERFQTEETTGIEMGAYIDNTGAAGVPTPTGDVLIDTGNSLRVFSHWFGPPAGEGLSVVVGRNTDSVPGIVYSSPVLLTGYSGLYSLAMTTAARRGGRAITTAQAPPPTMQTYLDEAFPRQVARQWWGNTVGVASFHDDWLAAGFASFSATLYDLAAYIKPDQFRDHWMQAREAILRNNRYGVRPNDAGPVWMGVLNDTYRTAGAGNILATSKGGFILHMLRGLMFDPHSGDKDFQAMMHDYVKTFTGRSASTEDFKSLVEKHMTPQMDLEGNHRMDWFFREWVYGTEVPSYLLEYSVAAEKGKRAVVSGKLTQSGVSPAFKMSVPIYGEFQGRKTVIGIVDIAGNTSAEFKTTVPETPKHILLNVNYDVLADKAEVKQVK